MTRRLAGEKGWNRLAKRLRYKPVTGDSQYDTLLPISGLNRHLKGIMPLDCLQYDDAFGRRPVSLWCLSYLAYFHVVANCAGRRPPTYPVRADVVDSNTIRLRDSEALCLRTGLGEELPTVGFATLDTEAYLIRLAVLSRDHLMSFRTAEISYQNSYEESTASSMGILADLLEPLADDWNLWQAYNIQSRWERDYEIGRIHLVMDYVQRQLKASAPTNEEVSRTLRDALRQRDIKVSSISVRPFSSNRIFVSIKGSDQFERAKEILELCKDVGVEFGYLRSNVSTVESLTSNYVSAEVANAIRDSSGLIQFLLSDEPNVSLTWIEAEGFYATMLGLPTVRIIDPRFTSGEKFFRDKYCITLPTFASAERVRSAIYRAFEQLDEMIRFGRQSPYLVGDQNTPRGEMGD